MWNRMKEVTIKKMYPAMLSAGDGIFSDLQSFNVPWAEMDISSTLNYGYYLNSASKIVSPLLFDIKNFPNDVPDGTPLTQQQREQIAGLVYQMFSEKWDRLWNLYNIEYNPIHDYNLVENESIDGEQSQNVSLTGTDRHDITKSESDGGTDSKTIAQTISNTGTNETVVDGTKTDSGTVTVSESTDIARGIYGFNSITDSGSDTESQTHSGTENRNLQTDNDETTTETKNLQTSDNSTETRQRNLTHTATNSDLQTRNLSDDMSESHNSTRELTKSGNIGFNKPQEMLTAELEFWQWNFFKSIFEDIDTVLTISIY